ncbi:MAG: hypothetical protein ABWY12_16950 [Burkholderiales bacterium]
MSDIAGTGCRHVKVVLEAGFCTLKGVGGDGPRNQPRDGAFHTVGRSYAIDDTSRLQPLKRTGNDDRRGALAYHWALGRNLHCGRDHRRLHWEAARTPKRSRIASTFATVRLWT